MVCDVLFSKMIPVNDGVLFANHLTNSSLVLIPFGDHLFKNTIPTGIHARKPSKEAPGVSDRLDHGA